MKAVAPGTVVIVLRGPHAGKRAIVSGMPSTGYITISGPAVEECTVSRRHVIATSTVVDKANMTPLVEEYLKTPFSLNDCLGVAPHELAF